MLIRTTAERGKDLAGIIEKLTGAKPKYLGPPSFAFEAEGIRILRNGDIEVDEDYSDEIVRVLRAEDLLTEALDEEEEYEDVLEISVPIDDLDARQLMNLIFIMYSRQKLINSAIGEDTFRIDDSLIAFLKEYRPETAESVMEQANRYEMMNGLRFEDGKAVFTGFPIENAIQYSSLAAMIVSQAKSCKRATAKIVEAENEKYAGRVWLNQLGLGGRGGKEVREVFLRNLSGDAAFRTEESKAKWKENRRKGDQ